MQRGASPGGNLGDFGLVGVVGGRLSRSVHLAANFGYILNSNPKSEAFGGGDATLLDRPDEFITGIGFDFPINKHFQPIAELKSTLYVGGRTPNAFENNPVDLLGGIRVYPRRWFGFSAAYRLHVNPQGDRLFGGDTDFPAGFRPVGRPARFPGPVLDWPSQREDSTGTLISRRRFPFQRRRQPSICHVQRASSLRYLHSERRAEKYS